MLRPLDVPFVAEAPTTVRISPRALGKVHGAWYSVPCEWADLDLIAWVGAATVTIVGRDGTRITHPRQPFGGRSIDYRHYLRALATKPKAVREILPDLLRDLGAPFPAVWDQLVADHAPLDAARQLATILGVLTTEGASAVIPRLEEALRTGAPVRLPRRATRAVALDDEALPATLRDVEVASGIAADYDQWLQDGAA